MTIKKAPMMVLQVNTGTGIRNETRWCISCADEVPRIASKGTMSIDPVVTTYASVKMAIEDGWALTDDRRWCPPDRTKVWVCPGCLAARLYTLDEIRAMYGYSLKTSPIDTVVYNHLKEAGRRGRTRLWRIMPGAPEPMKGWTCRD